VLDWHDGNGGHTFELVVSTTLGLHLSLARRAGRTRLSQGVKDTIGITWCAGGGRRRRDLAPVGEAPLSRPVSGHLRPLRCIGQSGVKSLPELDRGRGGEARLIQQRPCWRCHARHNACCLGRRTQSDLAIADLFASRRWGGHWM